MYRFGSERSRFETFTVLIDFDEYAGSLIDKLENAYLDLPDGKHYDAEDFLRGLVDEMKDARARYGR